MAATDHNRKKLSVLPHKPGIYLMKDRFGTVIAKAVPVVLLFRTTQLRNHFGRFGCDASYR